MKRRLDRRVALAKMGPEQFTVKYTRQNIITRYLINCYYNHVGRLVNRLPMHNMLEVGCGAGFSSERITTWLSCAVNFTAVDVDPELVRMARERNPRLHIEKQDIYNLPYDDNEFDVVLVLEVFEHLEDPVAALREVQRVTGKWLISSVPREPLWRILNMCRAAYMSDLGNTPGHIHHWSSRAFVRFMAAAGRVEEVSKPIPWTIVLLRM